MQIRLANGNIQFVSEYGLSKKAQKPRKLTKEELQQKALRDGAAGGIQPVPAHQATQIGLGQPAAAPAPVIMPPPQPTAGGPNPGSGPMTGPQGAQQSAQSTINPLAVKPGPPETTDPHSSLSVNSVVSMYNAAKNINLDELKSKPDKHDAAKVVGVARDMLEWAQKVIQVLGEADTQPAQEAAPPPATTLPV